MSPTKSFALSLIAASSFAVLSPASAALITVTQSAFSNSATVVNFEDLPGNGSLVAGGYGASVGLSLSANTRSYQYSDYGPTLANAASSAGLGSMAATWGGQGADDTGFSFATAHELVGFSLSSNVNILNTVISAYQGNNLLGSTTVSFAANNIGFVGFQDFSGIDRIVIGNNNGGAYYIHQLDNVMFQDVSTVPEPMSLALVGLGLLGLGLSRRRKGLRG